MLGGVLRGVRLRAEKVAAKTAVVKAKAQAKTIVKGAAELKNKANKGRGKIVSTLASLRKTIAHPCILEVPDALVKNVRAFLDAFETLLQTCDDISEGRINAWQSCLDNPPFQQCAQAQKILTAVLVQLSKAKGMQQ